MSTRRALLFSFLDRYSALVMSIISSMFIARLLTPADIGVFSVTMVFIMFISSMRDMGAGQYLVQEKNLTAERIKATWTVLIFVGALMALVVFLAAYPIANFYNEPRMVEIMWVISLNYAINPLGSMTYAWLIREMRFDSLAKMRFASSFSAAGTSVTLAWLGYGPISLAYGSLVGTMINAVVSLRYRPTHFGWVPGLSEVKRVVNFGGKISATGFIWNLASGAPELALGKIQTLVAAGLYSRGNGLATMFQKLVLDAMQAVATPMFAKAQRENGNITELFLRTISYVTALGWSFFVGLMLLAFPIVRVLYGDQWDDSIVLLRLLCIGMCIGLPASMCPYVLTATGRANLILKISLLIVPIHVTCVVVGAAFSLNGAGLGFIASQLLSMPIWLHYCKLELSFRWREIAQILFKSGKLTFLITIGSGCGILVFGTHPSNGLLSIAMSAALSIALIYPSAKLVKHPIQDEIKRFAKNIRNIFM